MVRSLAAVMRESDVAELDLAFGALTVRLRREIGGVPLLAGSPRPADPEPAQTGAPEHTISAPMVGTFYTAATPGSPPFISPGDQIVAGQTIGIIEAMKIMNEIAADRSGTVAAILASNGQPVEYGSPLVRLALGPVDRL
ncbi:MAG: biotin/lipoyl-containing protein [Thermomicrobiales bacterium]